MPATQTATKNSSSCSTPPLPDYKSLAASGMTDMDIPSGNANLPEAMFLFAYSQLQAAKTQPALQATWGRYARWWKRRLDPDAWRLIEARCIERAKELVEEVAKNVGPQQIETLRTMGMRPPGGGDARVTRMDAAGNGNMRGTATTIP